MRAHALQATVCLGQAALFQRHHNLFDLDGHCIFNSPNEWLSALTSGSDDNVSNLSPHDDGTYICGSNGPPYPLYGVAASLWMPPSLTTPR